MKRLLTISRRKGIVEIATTIEQCVVCLDKDATYTCIPCAHRVLCEICVQKFHGIFDVCPICRTKFKVISDMK